MTSNNLTKEEQIKKGKGTQQKGDWCELIAAAHFRKNNYHIFYKMSGPIDLILVHQKTGETRYIDVKYKNTRQGMKTKGRRINRPITTPLKNKIKIEAIYVGDDCQIEQAYSKGVKQWHKEFKAVKNSLGQYTGEVIRK
jgi:hypothetical protein|tara:strand:+ start:959 stop:1375 length:417 start_codon:yes stop_codon:yes gene_type:complete